MTVGRLFALCLAFGLLAVVLLGMLAVSEDPSQDLGPFVTGSGDQVEVAP